MSKNPSSCSAVEPAEGRRERTLAPSPAAGDNFPAAGVRGPSLTVEIVDSRNEPGMLSVRVNGRAADFKRALRNAGFKAGDRAVITLIPEFCPFAGGEWTNGVLTAYHSKRCKCHEDGVILDIESDEETLRKEPRR